MILLIDIGNSRVKWAWLRDGTLHGTGDAVYDEGSLPGILEALPPGDPPATGLRVANVGGEAVQQIVQRWAGERGLEPVFLQATREDCGVLNAYTDAASLGADRWAALIAVVDTGDLPACIVDSGTATTVDVLSADGEHLGGLILPGLKMMRDTLRHGTQGIGSDRGEAVSLLARDTGGGVEAGTLYALVAAIDRIAGDVQQELGRGVQLVLSGGDGPTLLPLLAQEWQFRPHLVLEGLAVAGDDGA